MWVWGVSVWAWRDRDAVHVKVDVQDCVLGEDADDVLDYVLSEDVRVAGVMCSEPTCEYYRSIERWIEIKMVIRIWEWEFREAQNCFLETIWVRGFHSGTKKAVMPKKKVFVVRNLKGCLPNLPLRTGKAKKKIQVFLPRQFCASLKRMFAWNEMSNTACICWY